MTHFSIIEELFELKIPRNLNTNSTIPDQLFEYLNNLSQHKSSFYVKIDLSSCSEVGSVEDREVPDNQFDELYQFYECFSATFVKETSS